MGRILSKVLKCGMALSDREVPCAVKAAQNLQVQGVPDEVVASVFS
jgi:hypothetical protein